MKGGEYNLKKIVSKILLVTLSLFIGLSVFAATPAIVSAQDGSGDTHDSWGGDYAGDEYYGERWEWTGSSYYFCNEYNCGYVCEWRVLKVYRRWDGSYYSVTDRYVWDWC